MVGPPREILLSAIVCDFYMEDLDAKTITSVPKECRKGRQRTSTKTYHGRQKIRHHKLSVVKMLYERASIITEQEDRIEEEKPICNALKNCQYPQWAIEKGAEQVK